MNYRLELWFLHAQETIGKGPKSYKKVYKLSIRQLPWFFGFMRGESVG